jgi:hypothetical protein
LSLGGGKAIIFTEGHGALSWRERGLSQDGGPSLASLLLTEEKIKKKI